MHEKVFFKNTCLRENAYKNLTNEGYSGRYWCSERRGSSYESSGYTNKSLTYMVSNSSLSNLQLASGFEVHSQAVQKQSHLSFPRALFVQDIAVQNKSHMYWLIAVED